MKRTKKTGTQLSALRDVLSYIRRYIPLLVVSVVLATVTVILTLYFPILTGRAIDMIIGPGEVDFDGIIGIIVRAAVAIALTALSQWLMSLCNNKMTYGIVRDIRRDAFEKLGRLPLSYIDGHPHGDVVSRVIADVDTFADGLLMGFSKLFTGVVTIIGTLVFMLSINVWIALVVVVITPVSLFVASFIAKRTYSMFQLQSRTRGEQTALIEEMVGNQKAVQAFGHEKVAMQEFDELNENLRKYSLRAIFFSSLVNPCTRAVNSLVYAAVGIVGAFMVIMTGGAFTIGSLTCFLSYANQYTKPFNEISSVVTELQNALACAARIF
ncbi:MAG: ABC transporter ATP-binding protein, partial [Clostridiales bacterium]|nr:ABC transporter ATP-binding protein [Clostridiales bacterium]